MIWIIIDFACAIGFFPRRRCERPFALDHMKEKHLHSTCLTLTLSCSLLTNAWRLMQISVSQIKYYLSFTPSLIRSPRAHVNAFSHVQPLSLRGLSN